MNVLFVLCDSLVAGLSGPYGDPVGGTPNLDALARDGVVFERAYCNSPLCAPSRASLVTGRYVSELGAYDNAGAFPTHVPTLGHALGAAGYDTAIVGKMHFVDHDQWHGFDQRLALETDYTTGHDPSYYKLAYRWDQPSAGNPFGKDWMANSYVWSERWRECRHHYDRDEEIHRQALAYLDSKDGDGNPFFCCVSYHAPHNPFWIPDEAKARFRDVDLPLPSVPAGVETCHGPMDRWLRDFHYEDDIADRLMTRDNLRWLYETYYGIVWDLDRRVGQLLAALEARGLAADTAVVFASDHGDMLAQRGCVQKRCFYEPAQRVALLGRFPGHWRTGARIATPVSLVDLLPTFADVTQAPLPPDLAGISLRSTLETGAEPPARVVFSEYHGEGVHAPCFMALSGDHKYIYVHGHERRLYDLAADPQELRNVVDEPAYAAVVDDLHAALLARFDPEAVAVDCRRRQRECSYIYQATLAGQRRRG